MELPENRVASLTSGESQQLTRGLKNRHIQLIALGGSIGTGLFLGVGQTIKTAGPSILLGYFLAGCVAFFIMRQLAEMVVDEPVAGSFSHFATRYFGEFAGFISGWNYWVLNVLVGMAELSAVGIYMHFWWPELPNWVSALGFFVIVNVLNLSNVSYYGEVEFWFSIVKVLAIVAMIAFGGYLLVSGNAGPHASFSNLWSHGGFFPNGISGLVMTMAVITFSFGGLELIGITAAEADNPTKSIPRATNQVFYRILIFYVGSVAILLSLVPWSDVASIGSPFVYIFSAVNSKAVAAALNVVVLTAALSVFNSNVFCNSRMLFGLAQQGNAPKALLYTNKRGVPTKALLASAAATALCVVLNYALPAKAFELCMGLVVAALLINWAMISVIHLRFRAAKAKEGAQTLFRSFGYPFTNYLCLAFLGLDAVVMCYSPDLIVSVILIPIWLVVLAIGYTVKKRRGEKILAISAQEAS